MSYMYWKYSNNDLFDFGRTENGNTKLIQMANPISENDIIVDHHIHGPLEEDDTYSFFV